MIAVVVFLIGLPAVAHATAFSTSVTLDLASPPFSTIITPVTLNIGDSLSADVTFTGSQALQISDAAVFELVNLVFVPISGSGFSGNVSLNLSGVSGDFLGTLPSNLFSNGADLFASVFGNLTNSSFTFTDVHAELTLTAGPEPYIVNRLTLEVSTPNAVLTPAAVPQPAALALLSVGLASFGAAVLRRRWSQRKG